MKENSLSAEEREQLVLNNMGLTRYIALLYTSFNSPDFEDLCSVATIGLIKASMAYDGRDDTNFATYSTACIHNEIRMYLNRTNKHNVCLSLYQHIAFEDGSEIPLIDEIPDPENSIDNFIKERDALLSLQNYTNIVFNYLDKRSRIIITYKLSSMTQEQIADKVGISQSYVSRLEKEIYKRIKSCLNPLNLRLKFINTYTLFKKDNLYGISFFINDIESCNSIIKTALRNISLITKLPDELKIKRCKNRVTIYFLDLENDFYFVYLILNEICDKGVIIKN